MKKILILPVIAALLLTVSCSKTEMNPESEAKQIISDMTRLFNIAAERLDNAETGKEVADILLDLAAEMKEESDNANKFYAKHPELRMVAAERFKSENEAFTMATARLFESLGRVAIRFKGDKDIKAASEKLQEIMQ